MIKITDLSEKRFRTSYSRDTSGNRKKTTEEIIVKRPVRSISSGARFGHYILDSICMYALLFIFQLIFGALIALFQEQIIVSMILLLVDYMFILILYPAYYFICELKWQRTPGKLATKSIVVNEYGDKPDAGQIVLRTLIRFIPFEGFSCLGNYSRGWHDRWSNTFVVTKEELKELKKIQFEQNWKEAQKI